MEKKVLNIILLSSQWEQDHRAGLHIELNKNLSVWSDVLFVEYPYSIPIHTVIKFKKRFLKYLKNGRYVDTGSEKIFTPFVLFHDKLYKKSLRAYKIDSYLLLKQLSKFISKNFKNHSIILWVYNPYNLMIAENFCNSFIIYDYYDNFSYDFNGNFNIISDKLNLKLLEISNLVFCTGIAMYNQSKFLNVNSYYIPNGHSNNLVIDEKINLNLKGDVIGYLGNIRDWIDFELIEKLLSNLKENQYLVFVGPIENNVKANIQMLKTNEKFIHIGPVQRREIEKYIKSFDVGIIPFKINKFTEGVLPYKFFDYISCNIQIVSTALPDLQLYSDVIGVAKNESEFINYCVNFKEFKNKFSQKKYDEIARNSTWVKRAEQMETLIKDKLGS